MKYFVVHVWLCVSGHVPPDPALPELPATICEHYQGTEEGAGLPSDCFKKAEVMASKYLRSDLVIAKIGCERKQ
jgi:hypothetical protein